MPPTSSILSSCVKLRFGTLPLRSRLPPRNAVLQQRQQRLLTAAFVGLRGSGEMLRMAPPDARSPRPVDHLP